MVQIGKGQLLDRLILGPAQIRAEAVGGTGRIPGLQKAGNQGNQGEQAHENALVQHQGNVPIGNALVDEGRHQYGYEQLKGRLHQHQQGGQNQIPPMGTEVVCQAAQVLQGVSSSPSVPRRFR